MKAVHSRKKDEVISGDWLDKAKDFEKEGNLTQAVAAYEKLLQQNPLNEYAYTRLMIIHRKNRDYKKELSIIKKGMQVFEDFFKEASKIKVTKKVSDLSKSLLRSLGLSTKKENPMYTREPLNRWNKRKMIVERLLKR